MKKLISAFVIFAAILIYTALFQVSEVETAIVLRFGRPIGNPIQKAGLYIKAPFTDEVRRFDKRLLNYDSDPKEIITQDKKNVVMDNYARWKIVDPLLFLQTVQNISGAQARLDDIVYSELREKVAKYTFNEIIAVKREEIMQKVTESSADKAKALGIEIVDVRIKRADLPKQNEENVYQRMEAERQQQAKKYRAEGQEKLLEIKSNAERQKTVILANAYKEAELIKGEGDAEALKIYADAYNRDPEFYKFVRTLSAYEKILKGNGKNKLILSSDSDLWKILEGQK
jgi:membrane protease subunit HflC